ncbi:sce7726 family protein [Paraliobacillus sp. X-1268]|uniref:sce7726 family protein n=1 Tax=Paraliobacillus sp. X-1268 TaxID=2213193 RepID=UPI000E3C9146|nr:sce7726 family protein [Paraliobacillus sp. X-1268]
MQNKNDCFEYAKLLSSQYSTFLSNESIEREVLNTFGGQLPFDKAKSELTPREFINQYLLNHYPNETSIKSTFINNVLFKTSNHVSIFELNVGKSRLDLCKINGNSTAFEIKTELDTPTRVRQQMKDYFLVFEKVYLICSVNNLDTMMPYLPKECGIYTYHITQTGRYIFKKNRSAIASNCISAYAQLSVLTKKDLNVFFECPNLETKDAMIALIITARTTKDINKIFKLSLKTKYYDKWNFLVENKEEILEIDYQWFFKNLLSPEIVYL